MSRAPQENASDDSSSKSSTEYLAAWHATMQLLREGNSFSGRERNCAFLNCGPKHRFANVSAVTGLDFPDDGRVVAMVDWDHDGDLDAWLHNRTGPRLRLMQNQTIDHLSATSRGNATNSLAIRLRGTKVNRDAIGARVEILFKDPATPRLMRTLYAGDAYLSQSSKWLHFGLGAQDPSDVLGLRVSWPGGEMEEFSGGFSGARLLLVEGSGKAEPIAGQRAVRLTATKQKPILPKSSTRVPMFNRPPLPILNVRSLVDGSEKQLEFSSRPTLLVLWASWCTTCKHELQELSQRENAFDVIAIAVDEVATTKPTKSSLATTVKAWQLKFPVVSATSETLDKLQLLGRVVLNRQSPLAVPTSFLIDDRGQLAAFYRGAVEVSQVASDVAMLRATHWQRRDMAIPLPGKWTTPPSTLLMRPVATIFRERGYAADYARFLKMEMDGMKRRRASVTTDEQRAKLDRQWASDNFNIAYAHEQQRDFTDAIDYYRQGLAVLPSDTQACLRLARCLQETGKPEEALAELRQSATRNPSPEIHIELAKQLRLQNDFSRAEQNLRAAIQMNPASVAAHFHLGTLRVSQRNTASAEEAFRAALSVDPDHFESLLNLGALLASGRESTEGIDLLIRASQLRPADLKAKLNLARALQTAGDIVAAQHELREALALEPDNAHVHLGLAQIALGSRQVVAAKEHLSAAVELNPNDDASKLRLAWLLATSNDENVRDADRAIALAKQLNVDAKGQHPIILDTLAAAYAAGGDFEAAQSTAKHAVKILDQANQVKMSKEVSQRLDRYKTGQPFVQLP